MDAARSTAGRRAILAAVALVAAVAAIYAPVRQHGYLDYDDMAYLVWNPDLEADSLPEALRISFQTTLAANWAPLSTLSHQLDRQLFGTWAPGALLHNVVLHALASVLLLFALWRLGEARGGSPGGSLGAAVFAAAVFAVHPLHVESVAWAIERRDVLSGLFFAALLGLYARYAEAPDQAGRYRAVLVCLALGLLSKPMLVTVPCLLLLLDYWPLGRLSRASLREKIPMFGMVAAVSGLTILAQRAGGAFDFGAALPLWARAANFVDALGAYLADAFWPVGLAAYYPHPGTAVAWGRVAAIGVALLALTGLAWRVRRRAPGLLVGWLWFVGMLVPVSGLVQVGMAARADRYTYLPLIGLAWALGLGVQALATTPARRRAATVVGSVALLALSGAAAQQVSFWSDSRTLYERMRSVHPEAPFPELRLGMVETIDGHFEVARPHLERALALDPAQARRLFDQIGSLAEHQARRGLVDAARASFDFGIGFARERGHRDEAADLRLRRKLAGL